MLLLRSIEVRPYSNPPKKFPYTLAFIQSLQRLDFLNEVTFLVGENGCGKSTFLEILACAVGSITVGSESVRTDKTLTAVREFSKHLKLSWSKQTRKGFFMRAEDFFSYAKQLAQIREGLQQDVLDIEDEYKYRSKTAQGWPKCLLCAKLGRCSTIMARASTAIPTEKVSSNSFKSALSAKACTYWMNPRPPFHPTAS